MNTRKKNIKAPIALFCLLLFAVFGQAQHFYKDIVSIRQITATQEALKKENIGKITLRSLEADGSPSRGFSCYQFTSDDFSSLTTVTQTEFSGNSRMVTRFSPEGKLVEVKDSTTGNVSTTRYTYGDDGKLTRLRTETRSLKDAYQQTETHQWQYTSQGFPEQMIRILNEKDTTLVTFKTDAAGKVTEEKTIFSPRRSETVYYYYSPEGFLSDIVRYNEKARRLLPDYMFEYDEQGRLIQSTHVPSNSSNYLTWLYAYNEAGLKIRETPVDKQRQMMGRIEYTYEKR